MRPKKVILIVDNNEQELSVVKFLLETRGYRVFTAMNAAPARKVLLHRQVELMLSRIELGPDSSNGLKLVTWAKNKGLHLPMILFSEKLKPGEFNHRADFFLPSPTPRTELLERIRALSARKRGPRKQLANVGLTPRKVAAG